jgi:multicomponent Na+:H+ antiporter subunit F
MMNVIVWICVGLLAVGAAGAIVRIVRGPSLLDRMLASDVLLAVIASGLLLRAAVTGDMYNLIFVLVVAAVGFLGSVTVARSVATREEG